MKCLPFFTALMLTVSAAFGQNINDQKVTFDYIQLPLIKIDPQFSQYNITIEHAYQQANEDSMIVYEAQRGFAMQTFETAIEQYYQSCDSLDRIHLQNMATWQKQVDAGVKNPDGTALTAPIAAPYPTPPVPQRIEVPLYHSDYDEAAATSRVNLDGFTQGSGEVEVTLIIHPLRSMRIVYKKETTGTARYSFGARYVMPIGLRVSTPSQGVLLETMLSENEAFYSLPKQESTYDHVLYMKDNKAAVFAQIEAHARQTVLTEVNQYLNNQFGFIKRTRTAEMYSVKSFKDYDYTDVTAAFTKATFALQAVGGSRDRSTAMTELDEAIAAIETILEESDINDGKARINDKVTGMLQCNLAELYMWKGDFNKSEGFANLALNSKGKASRHIKGEQAFYQDQRKRWQANY